MQELGFSFGIALAFKGFKELSKSTEALKAFSSKLDQSSKSVKALNQSIDSLEKSHTKIQNITKQFGAMKGELMGKTASALAITLPVKVSAKVEDSLNRINQSLNFDNKSLDDLRSSFLSLSSELGTPIDEIGELANAAARLGIKSKAELLAFSELGAKYQKVFELSNEETSSFMTNLSNIYKLNTEQMGVLGDKIMNIAKSGGIAAAGIAKVMNEVGGDAKLIGMNAEQCAALSAALVGVTKNENQAASTFKTMVGVFSNLNNASEETRRQFLNLGMDTEQLSAYFKQDASEAVKVFLNQIKTLPKDEMTAFLNSVFGSSSAGIMQNLVDNTEKYEQSLESLKNTKLGGLKNEFDKLNSSTSSNFEALSVSLSNLSASLGNALAPALNLIITSLTRVINFARELIEAFPNLSKFIASAVVVLTGASVALTSLKIGILAANFAFAQMGLTLKVVTTIFNILRIAFLTNPFGLVLTAIAAVAALIIVNFDKVKAWFMSFIDWFCAAWDSPLNAIKVVGEFFMNIWQSVGDFFGNLWQGIFDWFASKFEWLSSAFTKIKDFTTSITSFFSDEEEEKQAQKETLETKEDFKPSKSEIQANQSLNAITYEQAPKTSNVSSNISVNVSGTFNISSSEGVFNLKDFAKAIENSVLDALNKSADEQKQTTIWG